MLVFFFFLNPVSAAQDKVYRKSFSVISDPEGATPESHCRPLESNLWNCSNKAEKPPSSCATSSSSSSSCLSCVVQSEKRNLKCCSLVRKVRANETEMIHRRRQAEIRRERRKKNSKTIMTKVFQKTYCSVAASVTHRLDFFFVIRGAGAGQGKVGAFQRGWE